MNIRKLWHLVYECPDMIRYECNVVAIRLEGALEAGEKLLRGVTSEPSKYTCTEARAVIDVDGVDE